MLILTRTEQESVTIGEDIEITIAKIGKDFVKLAIKAPKNIAIFRKEVYESIKNSNTEAAMSTKNVPINLRSRLQNKKSSS